MTAPSLVLASASPRRARILEILGLEFEARPAHLPEDLLPGEDPADHVERLAREKAHVVAGEHPDALVLAGDTAVVLEGRILGKPRDESAAVKMLRSLSGRSHRVFSGLALAGPDGGVRSGVSGTVVTFREVGEEDVRDYVATGEPMDKAGAYGIQARGGALVSRLEGDYYAVVGLPVALLLKLLADLGWRYAFGTLEPISSSTDP